MKEKASLYSFLFLIILFYTIFVPAVGADNKIMPLGDSITQGTNSGVSDEAFEVSYRKSLYDKLKAAGYVVNDELFVGTLISGESVADFDSDHEGQPGWRADEIVAGRPGSGEGTLSDWLLGEAPNIVLLHIGTNDISGGNEDLQEVEDILAVIDSYESVSGQAVWVILALIIERGCDPYIPLCPYSLETTDFNNDVRDFVFFPRQAGGDRIILVDMQNGAGIDYDRWDMGGDMWDDKHPFATGYAKMADLWFTGLMDILPQADAGPDQFVNEFDPVTLDASGSMDPNNGNLSYQWVQTAGTAVVLSDDQAVQPTFVAPDLGSCGGTLTFRVTVTDEDELESTDTVSIGVLFTDDCQSEDVFCGGFEATIIGTEGNDIIEGTNGPDVIHGLGAVDIIRGHGGDDIICGGNAPDFIGGGSGNDIIYGGRSDDAIWGSPGNDKIYGEHGNDIIYAGDGNDELYGGEGHDILYGLAGDDILEGEFGNDTLYGGDGADELSGGWGPNNGAIDNNDTCYDEADTLATGCEVFYEQ